MPLKTGRAKAAGIVPLIMILIMYSRTWTGLNIRLSGSGTQQIGWVWKTIKDCDCSYFIC